MSKEKNNDIIGDSTPPETTRDEYQGQFDSNDNELADGMMSFGDHLNVLRGILIRSFAAIAISSIVIFIFKDIIFDIVFAPSQSDFILYKWINWLLDASNISSMKLEDFNVQLINTELSSQFLTHIKMSLYFGCLVVSPYILYQLFSFIRPALYKRERRYLTLVLVVIYLLFAIGLLMNYFVIFPISFRFLGTYQISESVANTVSLSSYTSSFLLLSLMMGLIFEMPILVFLLGKMGIINANVMRRYRKYAFIVIMIISALITPPDVFSLILVTIPIYLLYELSIKVLVRIAPKENDNDDLDEDDDIENSRTEY